MMIICDSGSTKVDFRIIDNLGQVQKAACTGLNPLYVSNDEIVKALQEIVLPLSGKHVDSIWFYGAGVVGEAANNVKLAFSQVFDCDLVYVDSDMLGAARALCSDKPGIACILGTGSNSCFYDGSRIVQNVHSGGYILGDEASGADLGKRLLKAYIKGLLPRAIQVEFDKKFGLDYAAIVQKLYREQAPSAFLGSFSPFLVEYRNHPFINSLVNDAFAEFLHVNVMQYDYRRYNVHFVGSVAYAYKEILEKCVRTSGVSMGTVLRSPIDALAKYHAQKRIQDEQNSEELMNKAVASLMARTRIKDAAKAKELLLKYGSVAKAAENCKSHV